MALSAALDIFRVRQYFNVITRLRELGEGVREDAGLLDDARRALVTLPFDRAETVNSRPFPTMCHLAVDELTHRRVALIATGGSGALASVVGGARAFEEAGMTPSVMSLCSGSALFGFPLAAGIPAEEVAEFCLGLRPDDYVDVNWRGLATLLPAAARGFAGIIHGDRLEATYRRLLGDRTLGDLAIPAYAPLWNIESNRVIYLGPRSYADLTVARAVRMAVSLPLFIQPPELDGLYWCDGGIVDIFPVHPVLDLEPPSAAAVAINGFYPPGFAGEDASGWQDESWSILRVASQVRTCQQVELARTNLARLEAALPTALLEPVSYEKVRGVGFYRQFLSTRDWPQFMAQGRMHTRTALRRLDQMTRPARPHQPVHHES
jgi:NTE family protein